MYETCVLAYANVWNIMYHMYFLCISIYARICIWAFIFRISVKLIGQQRSWEMVYDIGFKTAEIFLVPMWWKLQINQSWKSIELLLYQIQCTKAYVILSLMHRSSHNKRNKTGLVFLWFFCDFIWFWEIYGFKRKRGPIEARPPIEKTGLRVGFLKVWGFFRKISCERWPDCGLISLNMEGFFSQNDQDLHDPGRPPGRSDGRERPVTWRSLVPELGSGLEL
jgi:hypothetical protein